ncbi:flagella synthesis protein FlgN [Polaromonas sp. UC242_47]|uniref:flagella synthesis protein FlgN n=1 Tax=Polaromonas sp. UC242_47 TaxID=3374626 RepID=UPI0037878041
MSRLLLNHLTRECVAVGEFLELLDQEANAMTHGDFSSLPALTERKAQLADQIALLSRQRETEQLRLGFTTDRSGSDAAAAAGGESLQNAWQQLKERAALAREHNYRNGVMIHTHLDFTRQAINFLHAGGQSLYGPTGTHHMGASNGNTLAQG